MAQVTPTPTSHPKHNIHKFRDIKPNLGRENWVSCKHELLATARDRVLYATVLGSDLIPVITDPTVTMTASGPYIGTFPLAQLTDEWNDRNNTVYNQIIVCISPEIQMALDDMD
jgi:gag-polypeptide of LTR copia-type